MSAIDGLTRSLIARLGACNLDELRVIDQLLVRLELGRDRYGHLDLSRARDWEREEAEELLDMQVYRACMVLVDRDRKLRGISDRTEEGLAELRDGTLNLSRDWLAKAGEP